MGAKYTGEYLGNKGGYKDTVLLDFTKVDTPSNLKFISDCDLKYHTSWDWLMPVVEKIENEIAKVEITGLQGNFLCRIRQGNNIIERSCYAKIATVYGSCVDYIEWYNTHNNINP